MIQPNKIINNDLIKKIVDIITDMPQVSIPEKGDGWVNLASLGTPLKNANIIIKDLGYNKLSDLFSNIPNIETYKDEKGNLPVVYTRVSQNSIPKPSHKLVIIPSSQKVNDEEENKLMTRLRLENKQFIGQLLPDRDKNGDYIFIDIRNTDFTKIEDKERGVKYISIPFHCDKKLKLGGYYKFTWKLLDSSKMQFGVVQNSIEKIYPRDIVSALHNSIMRYPASAASKIKRSLDTLKKQLTQNGKEVFIYELIQNANDYPKKKSKEVEVEFYITNNNLIFQHTGEYFNPKNIAAICDINAGEKSDNTEAIGYKGIGFKTVFLDNNNVFLQSGDYSFRFDENGTDVINTPWQILPIWTDITETDREVQEVFSKTKNDVFRVKFALQPYDKSILKDRSKEYNYIDLFSKVFDTERVILFIPNVSKVSVYYSNTTTPDIVREKSSKDWCVSKALIGDIPESTTSRINAVLENSDADKTGGYDKIPEKYINFKKTAVRFACNKKERQLLPVEDAILYCYLPAKKAEWGFRFLMNTDMVPNGARDDVEDIELNHEITKIAGQQFFYWLLSLVKSGDYELGSIFELIPDFEECKKKKSIAQFIDEFEEGFLQLAKNESWIPAVDADGNFNYVCIRQIVSDKTDLTQKCVMSDKDFMSFLACNDAFLPVAELRNSSAFKNFLSLHKNEELVVSFENLHNKCATDGFKTWLKCFENNTRFIQHLLDYGNLSDFNDQEIFIEFEEDLFKASDLYPKFDDNFSGLEFAKRFIPHLNEATSTALFENEKW